VNDIHYPRGAVPRRFAPPQEWTPAPEKEGVHIRKAHDAWLWQMRQLAEARGWLVACWWDSRHSPAGFPDLFLVHTGQKRTMHVEAKTGKGRLTPSQRRWRNTLMAAGVEWYLMHPEDEPLFVQILEGKP